LIEATYIDHMGTDLTVANAARVSFGKQSEWDYLDWRHSTMHPQKKILSDRDTKLIHYLAEHKHISPFGHCFASFHIKAPVFVARQLVKHKFLRWNEISRRYVDSEPEFFHPTEWRGRSDDKKQGSDGVIESLRPTYSKTLIKIAMDNYKHLLSEGVCPEQARMVLPQSMMTEWYWSGSLDAFADMCALRCKPDTQAETAEVAWAISLKMEDLFPVSWVALRDE
jgi:thymidylate synthase (FAD)